MNAGETIKRTRIEAGLTQVELARRLSTTQSAVARLESARSNPRFLTLQTALKVMGKELGVRPEPRPQFDRTIFDAHIALTPLERVRAHDSASRSANGLLMRARLLPRESR